MIRGEPVTLAAYLGDEAAADVVRCGQSRGWTARVPARPWRATGHTSASLALLNLSYPTGVRKVVVKVAEPPDGPPAHERLADRYAVAARDCPPGFAHHLVAEAEPSWPRSGGGVLTFQKLAGDDVRTCRSLDQLPYPDLVTASRIVVGSLLMDWNDGKLRHNEGVFGGEPPTMADFVRHSVGGALSPRGSVQRWAGERGLLAEQARAVRFPDGLVCPNPMYLADIRSPAGNYRLDVLTGRTHGDLHLGNVLIPEGDSRYPPLDRFQLVDLDTYQARQALTVDPVCLLLSGIAHQLPGLPVDRWRAVGDALVDSTRTDRTEPPFDLIGAVFSTTVRTIRGLAAGLTGDWTMQYRLSTLATALSFTAYSMLGPHRRAWFFRLAAQCGLGLLDALNEPVADDPAQVADDLALTRRP